MHGALCINRDGALLADLVIVQLEGDLRYGTGLSAATDRTPLAGEGAVTIDVPGEMPELSPRDRETWDAFKHTPDALLECWRVSRHLSTMTNPAATLVLADDGGRGGLLALEEAGRPRSERRSVWTVAGDSNYLRWLAIAGTIDGVPSDVAAAIDWEIVQYRYSERVLAASEFAAEHVAALGASVELLGPLPITSNQQTIPRHPRKVWLPEPVAREAQTGSMLRALSGIDSEIVVSEEDSEDRVWEDTTWNALAPTRALFGDRISRSRAAAEPDMVILGSMTATPGDAVSELRGAGMPMVVPTGSVAAGMWPEAMTWSTEDDLAALLTGGTTQSIRQPRIRPRRESAGDERRARRVSVGVPVFRDVRYLDECVDSILTQTQQPIEIILMDDGSASSDVAIVLERMSERDPRIRLMAEPNRGVCVARNRMLDAMVGDAYLLVDADDILEPAFIERTAVALRADDTLSAVATWTRFFGEYDGIEAKPPFDARVGLRENPIVSTAALVDMAVRDQGVRFAPDLAFLYCEDWHVWSQIVATGGRMGLVPEPLIRHRTHRDSGAYRRTALAHDLGRARATAPLRGLENWSLG